MLDITDKISRLKSGIVILLVVILYVCLDALGRLTPSTLQLGRSDMPTPDDQSTSDLAHRNALRTPLHAIAYYRTAGLGTRYNPLDLDTQRRNALDYVERLGWLYGNIELAGEFTEIEYGRWADRPQLKLAIAQAEKYGAKLIFAQVYPLNNWVEFLHMLEASGVDFVACDLQVFCRETLTQVISIAEHRAISHSNSTRAGLNAAVARGRKLGGNAEGAVFAQKINSAKAHLHRVQVRPFIHKIQREGITTLQGIADSLMDQGVKTRRGKSVWRAIQVSRVLKGK